MEKRRPRRHISYLTYPRISRFRILDSCLVWVGAVAVGGRAREGLLGLFVRARLAVGIRFLYRYLLVADVCADNLCRNALAFGLLFYVLRRRSRRNFPWNLCGIVFGSN